MTQWCRLWEDMPDDPKFRLIARRANASISEVGWIFVHMMRNASCAKLDGQMRGWNDEVIGASIDISTDKVTAIREAMQGLVLDGEGLSGWAQRQPRREDFGSADRSYRYRENKRAEEAARLAANLQPSALPSPEAATTMPPADPADSGLIGDAEEPIGKPRRVVSKRTRLDEKAQPDAKDRESAAKAQLTEAEFRTEWVRFRDFHVGKGTLMADWHAAWRTWLGNRKTMSFGGGGAPKGHESNFTKATRKLLGELENATHDQGAALASTLPDAAFRTADDPILSRALGANFAKADERLGSAAPAILDLEPIRTERREQASVG